MTDAAELRAAAERVLKYVADVRGAAEAFELGLAKMFDDYELLASHILAAHPADDDAAINGIRTTMRQFRRNRRRDQAVESKP